MADLVSHPDEVKVVSRRFGQGATNIDRYLELDGYKAVQFEVAVDIGRTLAKAPGHDLYLVGMGDQVSHGPIVD